MCLAQVWTHCGPNWFFLPNPILPIGLNFQQQIHSKINIFRTLALKIVKWTLLNLTHWGLSKNTKNSPKIPIQFSVLILFNFHWENGSIFNSFYTIAPNSLKPSQCTSTHRELSKDTQECGNETAMVWEISAWQYKTKQKETTLLHR